MAVVARMYVAEIAQFAYNQGARTVKLQVVSGRNENQEWAAATPSGSLALTINNELAAGQFAIGEEYMITMERAEKA